MKRFFTFILFLIFTAIQFGCMPKLDKVGNYSYSFSDTYCSTGTHHFVTKDDMCSGLKSSGLNNNCAENKRRDYFYQQGCNGSF